MKLVTFTHNGVTRIGKVFGDKIIDLSIAAPALPRDMRALLDAGDTAMAVVRGIPDQATGAIALAEVKLEAPVMNPSKYLAIGMNYQDHVKEAAELGVKAAPVQAWFNKQVSCVTGPYDPTHMPAISDMLDYEVELCVVIGKKCRHVAEKDAASVIAGYMVANDVSVRDVQWAAPTWTMGKSFDTHGPVGPWLVTADEIPDPLNLKLSLTVNGETRQESNTGLMIHNIYQQIAFLSGIVTLYPGDLIATGTPQGVGAALKPPRYLKVGDVVRAEVEKIGYIENKVITEPR